MNRVSKVVVAIASAALLTTVPAATAFSLQWFDKSVACGSGQQVRIQGRTIGDTTHSTITVYHLSWYKGYKNNVTSTTHTHVGSDTTRVHSSGTVSDNFSNCIAG
jgi:hypothetical protein